MASSFDTWMKEYNEAVKLSDDISAMIAERAARPATGPDAERHASAMRRKITILGTRLDSLENLLTKLPGKQQKSEKEMNRRKDMLASLRAKVNQMASSLNMSNFANRDNLLGPEIKQADAISRTKDLDNHGIVGLQRQIMREQDEGLEKLEETVISTKHIALSVNEELTVHTRLIDDLDEHVELTDSRLQVINQVIDLVTNDEIKKATFQLGSLKATSADGFPALFFLKHWHLVRRDVEECVRKFLDQGNVEEGFNETLICLIRREFKTFVRSAFAHWLIVLNPYCLILSFRLKKHS